MDKLGLGLREIRGRERALEERRPMVVEDALNSDLVPAALATSLGAGDPVRAHRVWR